MCLWALFVCCYGAWKAKNSRYLHCVNQSKFVVYEFGVYVCVLAHVLPLFLPHVPDVLCRMCVPLGKVNQSIQNFIEPSLQNA